MTKFSKNDIVRILRRGGIGVMPTDTLYGIVGSVLSKKVVARIYAVRRRNLKKPLIILIHSLRDLDSFGIALDDAEKKMLSRVWPAAVSVLLPCRRKRFAYLHRGTNMLAFLIPADAKVRAFLKKTGPLVAPSANTEGAPPAWTIAAAKRYFGDTIDFYVDVGRKAGKPSTLVMMKDGVFTIQRAGAGKIK